MTQRKISQGSNSCLHSCCDRVWQHLWKDTCRDGHSCRATWLCCIKLKCDVSENRRFHYSVCLIPYFHLKEIHTEVNEGDQSSWGFICDSLKEGYVQFSNRNFFFLLFLLFLLLLLIQCGSVILAIFFQNLSWTCSLVLHIVFTRMWLASQ